MKKVIVTILVLSSFVITACSSFDSPSTTIEKFYTYVEEGKVNDASELFTKAAKELLNNYGGVAILSDKYTRDIKEKGGIKEINIQKEEITGDTAKVIGVLTYGNDSKEDIDESLIKEEGEWRIAVRK